MMAVDAFMHGEIGLRFPNADFWSRAHDAIGWARKKRITREEQPEIDPYTSQYISHSPYIDMGEMSLVEIIGGSRRNAARKSYRKAYKKPKPKAEVDQPVYSSHFINATNQALVECVRLDPNFRILPLDLKFKRMNAQLLRMFKDAPWMDEKTLKELSE